MKCIWSKRSCGYLVMRKGYLSVRCLISHRLRLRLKLMKIWCFDSLLLFWCGSRRFTFIPKYVAYYDSFEADRLLEREFEQVPLRCPVKKKASLRAFFKRLRR